MATHRRPGAGSVRRLPSGRWQARRTEADGTVRSLGTWLTRAEAERALAAAELDELAGDRILDGGTVGEWVERWLAEGSHRWRPTTARGNRSSARTHVIPHLGDVPIAELDRTAIFDWLDRLRLAGLAPRTIQLAAASLSGTCQTAVEHGGIRANPASRLRVGGRRRREPRFLTVGQVEAVAEAITHPPRRPAGNGARSVAPAAYPGYGLLVRVAAYTGLRPGELAGLRCDDVDLDRLVIHVVRGSPEVAGRLVDGGTKTGHSRSVPIPAAIVDDLAAHLADRTATDGASGWVFTSPAGGRHRHSLFYRRHFLPAAATVGLDGLIFYDLRHTFAALAIAEGAHPKTLADWMGHSSISVTMDVYGHLFPHLGETGSAALSARIAAARRPATSELSGTTLARRGAGGKGRGTRK